MIYNTDFQKTIEDAFLAYGASVAQERAIPDVRDGLKIGLRQGLYAQFSNKLTFKDKFQKAQKSVAAAMAQSYVHGDAAMYDTLIRAAKPWVFHYPIEAVQGSYGDPCAPDNHSAARYVEMKAGPLADYFFYGLKKNAIEEWYDNYDDTEKIPSVFPSIGYWNIVNGCSGIAVAMATSVPQFNLKEVNNALIKIIRNKDIDFDSIYCAPDFAQGGMILNSNEVKESIREGHGASIKLRAILNYIPDQNMIQATEMPFGVFTNTVIGQLKELTDNNENYGIERVVDHTKKKADIRIYLKKGTNPKKMIAKLYKDTSLENFFAINMIMLDQGRFPKVFGWREACDAYIAHIRECKYRETKFDLDKAAARLNIVEGLLMAVANIDEVVSIIRKATSPAEASEALVKRFNFNEEQTKAILAMKLSSLTRMDAIKIEDEKKQLVSLIEELQFILDNPKALDEKLIEKLEEVSKNFGDKRRTKILNIEDSEEELEPIIEQNLAVMLFDNNMFRIVAAEEMTGARRGRKGINLKPPKDSNLINTLYTTNLGNILCFSSEGKMYSFSLGEFDCGIDYSLYEAIKIQKPEEKILSIIDGTSFSNYKNIIFVTKNGLIKKSNTRDYTTRSTKGVVAIKLKEADHIQNVFLSSNEEDKIMIASNSGNYVLFEQGELTAIGRGTSGVKAITLKKDCFVASSTIIKKSFNYKGIITITSLGKGKMTKLEDFSETSRAIQGPMAHHLEKGEFLSAVYSIIEDRDKVNVIANNKMVTIKIDEIPVQGKLTAGVKIIKTEDNILDIEVR